MALVKGTNSYVTVGEADAYFADRLNASAWSSLTSPQKEQALVTATTIIDENNWVGTALYEDQVLAFPRAGSYFDTKLGSEIVLTESYPLRLVNAVYELALHLYSNPDTYNASGAIDKIKVGPIELTGITETAKSPHIVRTLIRPLLTNGGRNLWWRSN